jgi:TonB-linked SusC/RagA family outer membrane protein
MCHLAAVAWVVGPGIARGQGGADASETVPFTGRVVATTGGPVGFAQVVLPTLSLVTQTRDDGRFTINIPVRRVNGQTVAVNVRALGFKPFTSSVILKAPIEPALYTVETNPLHLGEVVVTGLGTTSSSEKLGTARATIDSSRLAGSNEPNVVDAMAASAPGVNITSNAGDPGASASIRIRGENTLNHTPDPLFVIDGIPIDNSATTVASLDPQTGGPQGGVASPNRAIDLNPDDIASIEVLKGAAAGAIYGARAGQGVVLITTKSGRGGKTTTTLNSEVGFSNTTNFPALQREYGEGSGDSADACITGGFQSPSCNTQGVSWGPKLAPGTPTYDHSDEVFKTGTYTDNNLTVSGGDTKTTYYASGSYVDQVGDVVGPHNYLHRSTARLKADREVLPGLTLTGNMSFSNTAQDAVQKGYNYSSITLGSWLTPPDFDNLPIYNQYGQQRSFRLPFPTPADEGASRGYDDPFFSAYNDQSTTNTNRTISNGAAVWQANSWLKFQENIGVDYSHDNRLQGQPIGNSQTALPGGQVIQQDFDHFQFTNTVSGSIKWQASPDFAGTFILGQDANTRSFQGFGAVGDVLLSTSPYSLNNTNTERTPVYSQTWFVHDLGYFSQATLDLDRQLYLKAGLRYDGTSTLTDWGYYPSASGAWDVTSQVHSLLSPISFAKIRLAYGQVGTEPLPYQNVHYYCAACGYTDFFSASVLSASGSNGAGLFTPDTEPGNLKVERTGEFETGADLGFFKDRADLSLTYYHKLSTDVILPTVVAASSGYTNQWYNGATIRNDGVEYEFNVRPIQSRDINWELGVMYAANWNAVTKLAGANFIPYGGLGGFGSVFTQLGGTVDAFRGYDYVRCGRGIVLSGGYNVDANCTGAQNKEHALFLDNGTLGGEGAGFPILDPTQRYLGNPDPKWTGNFHTSFRWKKWTVSALIDVREGGLVYDQTQQALDYYGTSLESAQLRGKTVTFGQNYMKGPVAGPGAGQSVTLDQNWFQNYLGGIEPPITTPYLIDGSYIKLRELALAYTYDGRFLTHNLGLSLIQFRVAARNLITWAHYPSGDPEVNAGGSETGAQGIDFFGIPQARSFIFTVTITK